MPHPLSTLRTAVLALAILAAPLAVQAQATPFVPSDDPAYQDLDALVAVGLVQGLVTGRAPYSRRVFAQAAMGARAAVGTSGATQRITEALERLEAAFAAEILELTLPAGGAEAADPSARMGAAPSATLARVAVDATWADSPARVIESRYNNDPDLIDADLDPLLQDNQGRILVDGSTVAAEARLDWRSGGWLAGSLEPRLWVGRPSGCGSDVDVTLVRGYARGLLGNLSVEVGRNLTPHGAARELGPVLSNNARGLDMIRLSMERPARLPWIFRHAGPVLFSGLVADMGRNRDTPGSKLFIFDAIMQPHPNFESGLTFLNHQMGEGAPDATWVERVRDLLFLERRRFIPLPALPIISDKAVAWDMRLRFPGVGAEAFVEIMTTDDHNLFRRVRAGLWDNAAWTGGLQFRGLGEEGRIDLWVEAGRNGIRPYTHHQFTSGMTLDRRVLGSPLGPLGTGVRGGVDWNGTTHQISVQGALERYQGDTYYDATGYVFFVRLADNPDEVRLRSTVSWRRQTPVSGLGATVRLGYERVTRFDFTDTGRSNVLFQVMGEYRP